MLKAQITVTQTQFTPLSSYVARFLHDDCFNFSISRACFGVWASALLNYANAFNAAVLHHRIYEGDTYGCTEAVKRTNLRAPMLMRLWAKNMQKHTHFNCKCREFDFRTEIDTCLSDREP